MRLSIQLAVDKVLDLDTSKTSMTIGRADECDLVIPHSSISRKHCRIDYVEGKIYITDLGSSNGVFIDGRKLAKDARTYYPIHGKLTLGKLPTTISLGKVLMEPTQSKILSKEVDPDRDYTATIRIAPIEVEDVTRVRQITIEAAVPKARPRNPVLTEQNKKAKATLEESSNWVPYIIIALLLLLGAVVYLVPELFRS